MSVLNFYITDHFKTAWLKTTTICWFNLVGHHLSHMRLLTYGFGHQKLHYFMSAVGVGCSFLFLLYMASHPFEPRIGLFT